MNNIGNHHNELTHETLTSFLDYNPTTGEFTWKISTKGYTKNRKAISKTTQGYLCVGYKGKIYLLHRLAWFYVYKTLPLGLIDHINKDKTDNRICNLRLATYSENAQNTNRVKKGFYKNKNKYIARIKHNNKSIYLGSFFTELEAKQAYLEAKRKYHSHYVE